MTNARRFSPIFIADVTPASIETLNGKNGQYVVMKGATISREGRDSQTRTVLAFGNARAEIAAQLNEGRPVALAVQYDGGSLKVIGLPREKVA